MVDKDKIGSPRYYDSLESLPLSVRDKVKQMRWLAADDHNPYEGLGSKVSDDLYWVV